MALLEYVTCQRCLGTGILIKERYMVGLFVHLRLRAFRGGADALVRWYPCHTCDGAGVLPVLPRAAVWAEVAREGIVLPEELRLEGDLDDEGLSLAGVDL